MGLSGLQLALEGRGWGWGMGTRGRGGGCHAFGRAFSNPGDKQTRAPWRRADSPRPPRAAGEGGGRFWGGGAGNFKAARLRAVLSDVSAEREQSSSRFAVFTLSRAARLFRRNAEEAAALTGIAAEPRAAGERSDLRDVTNMSPSSSSSSPLPARDTENYTALKLYLSEDRAENTITPPHPPTRPPPLVN